MSEVYDGGIADFGEDRPELMRLSLNEMARVLIGLDGTPHYAEGREFQCAKWYDRDDMAKYYLLEQAVRPAGSFNYRLRIFSGKDNVQWYDFQEGLARVHNRLCTYPVEIRVDLLSMEYDHAADCLRAELARRNYVPPLAPVDAPGSKPLTKAENDLFFSLVKNA